jgi:hypothetical protein
MENNMERIVFCRKCKYYEKADWGCEDECNHPDNIKIGNRYDKAYAYYEKDPSERNSGNACGWYKEKVGLWTKLSKMILPLFWIKKK